MRLILSLCLVIMTSIGLAYAGSHNSHSLHSVAPADALPERSIWKGEMEQTNPKLSYQVVLFIKKRDGNAFEGTTWYPGLGNALVAVSGKIDESGEVTFSEDKVIHAEDYEINGQKAQVVAGPKYKATLKKTTVTGTGEFTIPQNNQVMTMKFTLKLAE